MKHKSCDLVLDGALMADDSPESLAMLNVALNSQGYTAPLALNGLQTFLRRLSNS